MRGIISYGAYVPTYRLARESIRSTLGQGGGRGRRAVAGYDEDTTTMAFEAARRALHHRPSLSELHFATTRPAYLDKTNATAVHAALGLDPEVFSGDHHGSVRSGVAAWRAARDQGLVAVADLRTGKPGSEDEASGGDGAAAFLLGSGEDVIAEILAEVALTEEFLDRWRLPGDTYGQSWEERFGREQYLPLIKQAAETALERAGVAQPDRVIISSPHARAAQIAGSWFGDAAGDRLIGDVGYTGVADAFLRLAEWLDTAAPGETALVVVAADGADAMVMRATTAAGRTDRPHSGLAEQLRQVRELTYPTFLTWRGALDRETPRRPEPEWPAAPASLRSLGWKFAFTGSRCENCGHVELPPQRVCSRCEEIDKMIPWPLADRRASVVTYAIDYLAYSMAPPVIEAVLDFEGGGRHGCELTEASPDQVAVGIQVEMTFRRMYTSGGLHNYFWKARPVTIAAEPPTAADASCRDQ